MLAETTRYLLDARMLTLTQIIQAAVIECPQTGTAIAARCDVGQPTISNIRNSREVPRMSTMDTLAIAMGLEPRLASTGKPCTPPSLDAAVLYVLRGCNRPRDDLAKGSGLSVDAILAFWHDRKPLPAARLRALANVLGVDGRLPLWRPHGGVLSIALRQAVVTSELSMSAAAEQACICSVSLRRFMASRQNIGGVDANRLGLAFGVTLMPATEQRSSATSRG